MLSVLIPTYNYNTFPLVKSLLVQLNKEEVLYEIIVIDDASKSELNTTNKAINNFFNCQFIELKENLGRSAIRNLLANKAAYNSLLFLDADVLPVKSNFIESYLVQLKKNEAKVLVGGIAYRDLDKVNLLRWRFGKKSEEISVEVRKENPNKYLFTANFLIQKDVFKTIKFDEELINYGYEDLLFSKELEKNKIEVFQFYNPVFHLGIDENNVFIKKTIAALNNLKELIIAEKITYSDTRISSLYKKIMPFKVFFLIYPFRGYFERKSIKKSSVFYYNLFRLTYLYKIFKNS